MSEREKIELGIYILDKITNYRYYSYENCENINDALNEILNNLRYELEILDYRL